MSKNLAPTLPSRDETDDRVQIKWNNCLELIKEGISPQGFRTWISPIIPVNHIEDNLILRVPSQFFFEWIESHYKDIVYKAVKKIFGLQTKIDYLVASTPDSKPQKINLENESEKSSHSEETDDYSLDARYQFDNYYAKNDNELALRAAQTVAKQPGKTDFNPLFIYGESGCGKTHLINAIGNFILSNRKRKKVVYLSSENFLNEYIYALRTQKLELFHKKFQSIDVLLLDDIQFLSNKKKSQEGLFFFFSEMERKQKQIVITSNQSPALLIGLEKRLISFFQKGLIIDLIPPSYESRTIWINTYCKKTNLKILPEVREFLGKILFDGMHQMRAVMVRIAAHSSLLGKPVSLTNTKRLLSQIDAKWGKRNGNYYSWKPIKVNKIIKSVSEYLNIPVDILLGYSRQREVSFARQIAIYLAKELSGESLRVIGYHFNDRHYTAILHNYKRISNEMKNNPSIYHLISEIKNQLTSQ
jgi:chromosomal replication initiator protein